MGRNYSNNAITTTLTGGVSAGATTISVAATTGFPSVDFILALEPGTANQELVLVTAVAGLNLTVTRGYDGTTAVSHSTGATVQHSHAAKDFADSRAHEVATAAHGATGAVVGTTNSQTLTNKTLALGSNAVSGTIAQLNTAVTDADLATLAGAETLTNKTVALGSNTVSGTKAQFDTACTDADFASLAGTETLTNKTLTSPTVTGLTLDGVNVSGAWGSYVPTYTNFSLGNGTVDAKFTQIGKTVIFEVTITLGSTSSVSGNVSISLPATPRNTTASGPKGTASMTDVSASANVHGVLRWNAGTSGINVAWNNATPTNSTVLGTSQPFVWATGDVVSIQGTYEAA